MVRLLVFKLCFLGIFRGIFNLVFIYLGVIRLFENFFLVKTVDYKLGSIILGCGFIGSDG